MVAGIRRGSSDHVTSKSSGVRPAIRGIISPIYWLAMSKNWSATCFNFELSGSESNMVCGLTAGLHQSAFVD
jgi:hypothetical protein